MTLTMSLIVIYYYAFSFLLVLFYILNRDRCRKNELLSCFSCPKRYPLVGNIPLVMGSAHKVFKRLKKIMPYLESPTVFWLFNKPVMFVYDPETFKAITNKSINRGLFGPFADDLFTGSLLALSDYKLWKDHRRFLTPVFNVNNMASIYIKIHDDINKKIIEKLDEVSNTGKTIDLKDYIFKEELTKIYKTLIRKPELSETEYRNHVKVAKNLSRYVIKRMLRPWLYPKLINQIVCFFNGIRDNVQTIWKEIENAIEEGKKVKFETGDFLDSNPKLFIDYLLSSEGKKRYNEEAMAGEILTFLDAGYETSAIAISFTLLSLATRKEFQDLVYEEIREKLGNDPITELEKLNKLTFLEQCINETLRLFPPVPASSRMADEDITLKDGRIIPKGTPLILTTIAMHRDSTIYENPGDWNPNRFDPDQLKNRHPYCFAPFSFGPRQCIGYKYAYMNVKNVLAKVLRKFEFTSDMKLSAIKFGFDQVLHNLSGYRVQVKRRNN